MRCWRSVRLFSRSASLSWAACTPRFSVRKRGRWRSSRARSLPARGWENLQAEIDFEGSSCGYGHAVSHGGFETIFMSALNCLLVKAGIERPGDPNNFSRAVFVDKDGEDNCALSSRRTCCISVFRFDLMDYGGR